LSKEVTGLARLTYGGTTKRMIGNVLYFLMFLGVWMLVMFVPLQDVAEGFLKKVALIYGKKTFITNSVASVMFLMPPFLIVLFMELKQRSFRKEFGLPLDDEILEQYYELEADGFSRTYPELVADTEARIKEEIARENAMMNSTASSNIDKTDIGYWFDLLQKGAITQQEYNAKKMELM